MLEFSLYAFSLFYKQNNSAVTKINKKIRLKDLISKRTILILENLTASHPLFTSVKPHNFSFSKS